MKCLSWWGKLASDCMSLYEIYINCNLWTNIGSERLKCKNDILR